jgi:predicted AlkP superfamily pyrophosphatase or phosphodiesterase
MRAGQTYGAHGYDNQLSSMGALFVAMGPDFKQGLTVPPFANVHVYPLLAAVLHLQPAGTDGSLDSVRTLLR